MYIHKIHIYIYIYTYIYIYIYNLHIRIQCVISPSFLGAERRCPHVPQKKHPVEASPQ